MTTVYLQYAASYTAGAPDWSSSKSIRALRFDPIVNTRRSSGYDSRDIPYNHRLSKRASSRALIISADELDNSTNRTWMTNFYQALAWRYNMTDANWDTQSVEVNLVESGDMPLEFIAGHKDLWEVQLILEQKEPDS